MKGIRKLPYFYTLLPNTVGAGADLLSKFAAARINFLALSGFPSGRRVQLDFFPVQVTDFKKAARLLGVRLVGPRFGFLLQADDAPGAVAAVLKLLANAGIDVVALDAVSAGKGRFGMMFWVAPGDVRKASKVLGAKSK